MFGYVTPDKPNLLIKEFALYKSVYCGICKSIKKYYGNLPRFTTNYDSVFLSILVHNYLNKDYVIERKNCILHPLKKRPVALDDELTHKIITVNILLAYHKFTDDIVDGGGLKKKVLRSVMVEKAYKKACKFMPQADEQIKLMYQELRKNEQGLAKGIDRVSDSFATMLESLSQILLEEKNTEELKRLFYNIGKWIYLADALDDLEKDKKSGNYNVLIATYGKYEDLAKFKTELAEKLDFTFNCIFRQIQQDFENTEFNFNTGVIRNIIYNGITLRTKMLMESNCKCKKIRI